MPSPFINSGKPLTYWYPPGPDYGTNPDAINPDDLPTGWTPQGAALMGGAVARTPVEQLGYNTGVMGAIEKGQQAQQAANVMGQLGGLDLSSPEGQSGLVTLLGRNPEAVSQPKVKGYLDEMMGRAGRMGKGGLASNPMLAASAAHQLNSFDPDIAEQVRPMLGTDPQGALARGVQLQKQRAHAIDLIDRGIPIGEHARFQDAAGNYDPIKIATELAGRRAAVQGAPLAVAEFKEANKARTAALDALSGMAELDSNGPRAAQIKQGAFVVRNNRPPKTPAEWQEAYYLAKAERMGAVRNYNSYNELLQSQGKRPLPPLSGGGEPLPPMVPTGTGNKVRKGH